MIVLFDRIGDSFESGGRMIEFARNLDFEFWMTCRRVVVNRDAAIGRDQLGVFSQDYWIDFK